SQDNPEIADWETKWAVEHGITFFIYCWYRTSQNGPVTMQFEKSVFDDALFKSRYGDQMKFTIMWENQTKGTSGITDEKDLMENLMPYWIEKFFKRDNYLKIDNKPVLYIYRPLFVSDDLGGDDKAKAAFNLMREACKKAGFDGMIIMGEERGFAPESLARFKAMGLDYTLQYCWYIPNSPSPDVVIESQMEQIRNMHSQHDVIPQVITLSQAWSGWSDEGTIWKLPPADFEILLRKGKAFVENNFSKDELGSKMIILDNWNEWSEGHYIAPYREYGFGYLDAVRRVFSNEPEEHEDLIPEDIGMGPYYMPMDLFETK
ncbi:MAG: glycoside hydrolase family 99-like domain-containing protein, partial [Tannerella sp.]|nr:glycoside hydrolase family 99-like domain-containing protein [Tannerella sp.]